MYAEYEPPDSQGRLTCLRVRMRLDRDGLYSRVSITSRQGCYRAGTAVCGLVDAALVGDGGSDGHERDLGALGLVRQPLKAVDEIERLARTERIGIDFGERLLQRIGLPATSVLLRGGEQRQVV